MKKFACALSIALIAVCARATTVSWASGNLSTILESGISATDVTAYYVILDQTTAEVAQNLGSATLYSNYTSGDYGTAAATRTPNALSGQAVWNQVITPDLDAGDTAYVLAVYSYTDAGGTTKALATVATYIASDADPDEPDDNSTNEGIALRAYAANQNSWAVVPEPATVALLALGLAAIGSRRKTA